MMFYTWEHVGMRLETSDEIKWKRGEPMLGQVSVKSQNPNYGNLATVFDFESNNQTTLCMSRK
jgi:hypothetical protein